MEIDGVSNLDRWTSVEYLQLPLLCTICMVPHHIVRKIKACDHVFCADCLEAWLSFNKICPLCRTAIETPDMYIAYGNSLIKSFE